MRERTWLGRRNGAARGYHHRTMSKTTTFGAREMLLDLLDNSFDKRSWHGANLTSAIRGVSAKVAARRVNGRKTIWEQTLHAAYWKQAAMNKLTRTSQRLPRRGSNWLPMPANRTETTWRADRALLHEIVELHDLRASVRFRRPEPHGAKDAGHFRRVVLVQSV